MDLTGPGLIYVFLIIPTLFALVVVGQGVVKMVKEEKDGLAITVIGIAFLGLVAAAYIFFIR